MTAWRERKERKKGGKEERRGERDSVCVCVDCQVRLQALQALVGLYFGTNFPGW